MKENEYSYWDSYYRSLKNFDHHLLPSQFACFFLGEAYERGIKTVTDIAGGNGKDSFFFLRYGLEVTIIEKSEEAVRRIIQIPQSRDLKIIKQDVAREPFPKRAPNAEQSAFYCRFFIHTLPESLIDKFFMNLQKTMIKSDLLFLEYRNTEDKQLPKFTPSHKRYYHQDKLICQIANKHGFTEEYCATGIGMAKKGEDNANVTRKILRVTANGR